VSVQSNKTVNYTFRWRNCDDDNDAEAAYDWADRHPAAARHDETTLVNNQSDEAAEEAAVQERRPPR